MAIITLQVPSLTRDQKKKLGNEILFALQNMGIAPASTILVFKPLIEDVFMDGLLVEAPAPVAAPIPAPVAVTFEAALPPAPEAPRKGGRLKKSEKDDLRSQLLNELRNRGSLSSFEAQEALGMKDQDGSPATLRRLFSELEEEGLILKTGQKRGTRYTLKGVLEAQKDAERPAPPVKLIKGSAEPAGEE